MIENEIVAKARKQFDKDFFTEGYMSVTSDDEHLKMILNNIKLKENDKCLDLGTGSGYVAFALADKFINSNIVGLDIVINTIERNNEIVREKHINNLSFITYNGLEIPFNKNEFDAVNIRYALHHFPDIRKTIKELYEIVKKDGQIFISDPTPNDNDTVGFVDDYMKQREDGHVKFYTQKEYVEIFKNEGLELINIFRTKIRFPRVMEDRYIHLLNNSDKSVIDSYEIEIINGKIYITEQVLNMSFIKK